VRGTGVSAAGKRRSRVCSIWIRRAVAEGMGLMYSPYLRYHRPKFIYLSKGRRPLFRMCIFFKELVRGAGLVLKGHGFTPCGKDTLGQGFVTGHDFSRANNSMHFPTQ
jgi:hypothetical protein